MAPTAAIGVVVRNLVHLEPVYALGEWAAPFDAALLDLDSDEVGLLNDDRVERTLARLLTTGLPLLTRLVLDAVAAFSTSAGQRDDAAPGAWSCPRNCKSERALCVSLADRARGRMVRAFPLLS